MSTIRETVTARIYRVTIDQTSQELTSDSPTDLATQLQALSPHVRAGQLARLVWQDDHAQVTVGVLSVVAIGRVVRQVWGAPQPRRRRPNSAAGTTTPMNMPAPHDDDPLAFFDRLAQE